MKIIPLTSSIYLVAALVMLSNIGCYKPFVSPEAIEHVTEIVETAVTPELEPLGTVEVHVTGDARYPELGATNGRSAVRQAAYEKGATHFAIVVIKQGMMSTDVIAKVFRKKGTTWQPVKTN